MDTYIANLLVIGLLLLLVTLGSSWISRLPLSYALIYLVVGVALGPYGVNLIASRPEPKLLEHLTEFVVIVSLYSGGLKMNRRVQLWAWNSTARLIGFLMPISIFAIAAIAHLALGLSIGAAILLGAILAPTDPVLASEVQLTDTEDRDELRFALTSEGGLNDALAFPFVYFGLYWLKDPDWQSWFKEWVIIDVLWATTAGIVMGYLIARGVVLFDRYVQKYRPMDELIEDFVGLSTILLAYSLTELVNGYGFVAVFVAGVTAQESYRRHNPEKRNSQIAFIERIEKLMEVGMIALLGSLLRIEPAWRFLDETVLIAGLLIFVIRPVGAWISTIGFPASPATRWLMGWFGIRGVGSLYYLAYTLSKGLQGETGEEIAWIVYLTVVISVVIHGMTSTPLMNWYEKHGKLLPQEVTPLSDDSAE